MTSKLLLLLVVLVVSTADARPILSVGSYRLGALAGLNALFQDVGSRYDTAPKAFIGGQIGYSMTKSLMMTAAFQGATHGSLSQTLVPIGASEYLDFEDLPVAPHVDLGLIYISNKFSDLEQTSSGFGLTFGAGADKHISEQWLIDFAIRYIKGFEQSVHDRNLGSVKSLQDGMQLIVGLHYEFTEPNLK